MTVLTRPDDLLAPATRAFYRDAMALLNAADVPFLVGGAYALGHYTGIVRHTKDFDVFVRRADAPRALAAFAAAGYATEVTFPHWIGKAFHGEDFVDVIFSSGNGEAEVDDGWFDHAVVGEVLGVSTRLCPAEEIVWQKAFVQERERFDGADVLHLIHARAEDLDWPRLLERFGRHWRVLLGHLVLFGYVYSGERQRVPAWVLNHLLERLRGELGAPTANERLCRGPLLSRGQYLADIGPWGYDDARLEPSGRLRADDIERWTRAIDAEKKSA